MCDFAIDFEKRGRHHVFLDSFAIISFLAFINRVEFCYNVQLIYCLNSPDKVVRKKQLSSSVPFDHSDLVPKRVSFKNSSGARFVPKRAVVFQPDDPMKKNLSLVCPEEEQDSFLEGIGGTGLNLFPSANDLADVRIVSDGSAFAEQATGLAAQTPRCKVDRNPKTSLMAHYLRDSESNYTLAPEDAYLAKLLGRQLTRWDHEEYYWEELPAEDRTFNSSAAGTLPQGVVNVARKPIEWIGRATLRLFRPVTKAIRDDGDESFIADEEMNKSAKKKPRGGGLSDFMISVVAGVLIATVIVFPVLKLVGREVIVTIAKSAVRKIGQKVTIQHGQDSSILLPFLSEQMLHPRHTILNPEAANTDSPSEINSPSVP